MTALPVFFLGKHVHVIGLAGDFKSAYALCASECRKNKLVFKKERVRCTSSSVLIRFDNDISAELPCFIYLPKTKSQPPKGPVAKPQKTKPKLTLKTKTQPKITKKGKK